METKGRERRHRYYTLANYRKLVDKESLDRDSTGSHDITLDQAGGFLEVLTERFYRTEQEFVRYSEGFKDKDRKPSKKERKSKSIHSSLRHDQPFMSSVTGNKASKRNDDEEHDEELDFNDKRDVDVVVQPGTVHSLLIFDATHLNTHKRGNAAGPVKNLWNLSLKRTRRRCRWMKTKM